MRVSFLCILYKDTHTDINIDTYEVYCMVNERPSDCIQRPYYVVVALLLLFNVHVAFLFILRLPKYMQSLSY